MPIVIPVEAIVVVDPMLACQKLKLGKAGGIAKQEIDIGIAGKRARVEGCGSLCVGLQLLVLVVVEPAEAEFELVPPFVQERSSR